MINHSIVIPIHNEEQNIIMLHVALKKAMDSLGEAYEIIFVNDGSVDASLEVMRSIKDTNGRIIIVDLAKNYGKSAALHAGFSVARGKMVITIDGDLQNDPQDILIMLSFMQARNLDVGCGWRHERKDPWIKRISSKIGFITRRLVLGDRMHDAGCTLSIFRKEALRGISLPDGMHRFLTFILMKKGLRTEEMKIRHNYRRFGKSKSNIHNRIIECLVCLFYLCIYDVDTVLKRKMSYKVKQIIGSSIPIKPTRLNLLPEERN